jgi:putative FmdB family regulatory protein
MPTYEYCCESCGHKFDELQSFKDEPLKVCPQCHQESLRRLFGTGAAILFKGSGFYETDYRSESYKKAAQAEKEAGKTPATNGTTDSKSTATPAAAESPKSETKNSPSTS